MSETSFLIKFMIGLFIAIIALIVVIVFGPGIKNDFMNIAVYELPSFKKNYDNLKKALIPRFLRSYEIAKYEEQSSEEQSSEEQSSEEYSSEEQSSEEYSSEEFPVLLSFFDVKKKRNFKDHTLNFRLNSASSFQFF